MSLHEPPPSRDDLETLYRLHLTLDDVERHVMLPDHLREAKEWWPVPYKPGPKRFASPFVSPLYTLDVDRLRDALHDALTPCLMGYALELRRGGQPILTQQWRWSRSWTDGLTGWSTGTPMHLASVSKLVTAIALVRLLARRGLSHDDPIEPWLPAYWPRGSNVGNLRFRHLLEHRSGLFAATWAGETGPCDFAAMKQAIADGTSDMVTRDYKNINYSLCRILIATLNGDVDSDYLHNPPPAPLLLGLRDPVWDVVTTRAYARYVNDQVFAPAGVAAREFEHSADAALAYGPQPDSNPGWNSGDLRAASATVGWHLSVHELLRVLATFRRAGTIMSAPRARTMLDRGFGLDTEFTRTTPMGTMYAKGGWWENDGRVEQSMAFILPRNMELVVLANSPSCAPTRAVMGQVAAAIESSMGLWLFVILSRFSPRLGDG